MLLQALHDYAVHENLVESVELTSRTIHLALNLEPDGTVSPGNSWVSLDSPDPKDKKGQKRVLGRSFLMPRFPGVPAGGKAYFLADGCVAIFGIDPNTGIPWPDDPKLGKNPTKSHRHFWRQVEEASEAMPDSAGLRALLNFRDRYLKTGADRADLRFAALIPIGKDAKTTCCAVTNNGPIALDGRTLMFHFKGVPIFEVGSTLHAYWAKAYRRQTSTEAEGVANTGLCLVTGRHDQPIAKTHSPTIKGIPKLPPIGGYIVSFDRDSPAFASYGFEGSTNAPVSESAVTAYTLALNALLANPDMSRKLGSDLVVCSWFRDHPSESKALFNLLEDPVAGEIPRYFDSLKTNPKRPTFQEDRYYSISLAANGGRVAVRRWVDQRLKDVVANLRTWFDDLAINEIPRSIESKKAEASLDKKAYAYRSTLALAWATARTPSDVRSTVHDILLRAALEGTNPEALLAPTLARIRVAATRSGANLVYQTSKFALIKLILNRSEKDASMKINSHLSETNDPAYNCGRLLAIYHQVQRVYHQMMERNINATIVDRFYGSASGCPANVFPSLDKLSMHHLGRINRSKAFAGAGVNLEKQINAVLVLFQGMEGRSPEFPGLLTLRQQGRFALGFHHQRADDFRRAKETKADEKAGQFVDEAEAALAHLEEQE